MVFCYERSLVTAYLLSRDLMVSAVYTATTRTWISGAKARLITLAVRFIAQILNGLKLLLYLRSLDSKRARPAVPNS